MSKNNNEKVPFKPLLTAKDVADLLKISNKSVYRKAKAREIPHYRFGRIVRFALEDVLEYREKNRES